MNVKLNDAPISCDSVMKNFRSGDDYIFLTLTIEESEPKDDQYYIGLVRGTNTITLSSKEKESKYKVADKEESTYLVNYKGDDAIVNLNFRVVNL